MEHVLAWVEWQGETLAGGVWRPTVSGSDIDGWVVFAPYAPLPTGAIVTMTVEAVTVTGKAIGPISKQFRVAPHADTLDETEPCLVEVTNADSIPSILATPVSSAYRLAPPTVFDGPVTVQIPVPDDARANKLRVYYFSESERHRGWYPAERVTGWLTNAPPAVVEEDGQRYLEFEVNHAGVVQVGEANQVNVGSFVGLDIGVDGTRWQWLALSAVLLALSVTLGVCLSKQRVAGVFR